MRERIVQGKKAASSVSIPTLKQPTRGFGLDSLNASPSAATQAQPINKPITHDISRISLRPQAKLTIGQPGDSYEQEADSVAQQVMQRMAQPGNRQSIQRQEAPEEEEELQMKSLDISTLQRQEMPEEEELQMKPLDISTLQCQEMPEEEEELQMKPLDISTLQRQEAPEEDEELQMKPLDISTLQRQEAPEEEEELQMSPMVQRKGQGGMAATPDLETSINQARGGGQPLGDNIRKPMEQAFGADFGGVKVHTDSRSDQLNQSIQARAFTTGQDVFFRQGEYNPGSRGGQELLAHELTHVVQQNGGTVQRSSLSPKVQREAMPEEDIQAKSTLQSWASNSSFVQRKVASDQFNVIGEKHNDYENGRDEEKKYLMNEYGIPKENYWTEAEFKGVETTQEGKPKKADPIIDHVRVQLLGMISVIQKFHDTATILNKGLDDKLVDFIENKWGSVFGGFLDFFGPNMTQEGYDVQDKNLAVDDVEKARLKKAWEVGKKANKAVEKLRNLKTNEGSKWFKLTKLRNQKEQRDHVLDVRSLLHKLDQAMGGVVYSIDQVKTQDAQVNTSREQAMIGAANRAVGAGKKGAWKIGNYHVKEMMKFSGPHGGTKQANFTLTLREEFLAESRGGKKIQGESVESTKAKEAEDINSKPVARPRIGSI